MWPGPCREGGETASAWHGELRNRRTGAWGSGGSQTSALFRLHTESKQIQHHKSRCKCHSFTGWHLGYCSQRLLSTPSLRKGRPAPLKARSSSYLTPKDEKSLTEVPLEAQKETQGPIDSAECRFPTAQVNGLPVPNMQQAGIWQSQRGICQRQAFPTALWQVQLPSKQHRVSTKTSLCFWNHTQSIMWNLSLNSKTN